jgi:hypothetical protein
MKRGWVLVAALAALGCDDESATVDQESTHGGFTDEMPEDLPAGGCDENPDECESGDEGSEGDSRSSGVDAAAQGDSGPAPCERSADCNGAGACVASYEEDERGDYVCRFACVPTLDEAAWCRDDASCCDPAATCTARGYCVVLDGEDEGLPDQLGGSTFSDTMPEDLPAGGGVPPESVATPGA